MSAANTEYALPIGTDPFQVACLKHGLEDTRKDSYVFASGSKARSALTEVGFHHQPETPYDSRPQKLYLFHSKVVWQFKRYEDDESPEGFAQENKLWQRVVGKLPSKRTGRTDVAQFDDWLRCMESEDGKPFGWYFLGEDGVWHKKQAYSVKLILLSKGNDKATAERIMGALESDPWKVVQLPFASEYPERRIWNLRAPQWAFLPVAGPCPHWDIVCDHIGDDLTRDIKTQAWAQAAGIKTGGDYIRAWFAAILREPREPTPYLFLFGPENSGKSILHESFSLLVTKGVIGGDRALTSDKNGELDGAILAVIEERDIRQPGVREKLKAAVTALMMPIRAMGKDVYMVPNYTHWVQTSNDQFACPKFPGDSRIQPIHVGLPAKEIGKPLLIAKLREEAPAFLHKLASFKLPKPSGRLRIPLVETAHSRKLEDSNTPQAILGIIELIDRNRSWRGTAPELRKLVKEVPGDIRTLRKLLESNQVALGRGNVRFEEVHRGSKTKVTKQLILKAIS